MNIFELSIIATPIAGALAGGSAAGIAGAGAGIVIGLVLYGMIASISALMFRKSAGALSAAAGETRPQWLEILSWLGSLGTILAFCALPLASWKLTALAAALVQY